MFLWGRYIGQNRANSAAQPQNYENSDQVVQSWDRFFGPFVSPSDTLAQWIMAILTVVACFLLFQTLRQTNKTNESAIRAADAANQANEIMRTESRPWLDFEIEPSGAFRHMADSKSVAIPFNITLSNKGNSPAFNVAYHIRLKPIAAGVQGKEVDAILLEMSRHGLEVVFRRSREGNFTTSVFTGETVVDQSQLTHILPERDGLSDGVPFGIIFSAVVGYGPITKPTYGSVLSGYLMRTDKAGLYNFEIADLKCGTVECSLMPPRQRAKLF